MSTSGSTDYSVTRDNIIYDALYLLNAIGETETPSTTAITRAARVLNNMIKAWQADGLNMWTITDGVVFLTEGKARYALNATSGDDAAKKNAIDTHLDGSHSLGVTSLTVDDTTEMTVGDKINIELDDGTYTTTTISTIPSDITLTIASGLGYDCSDRNRVTFFQTKMDRPAEVLSVVLRNEDGYDRVLTSLSSDEYTGLPNKVQSGTPNSYYYDPQMGTGYLNVWPVAEDSSSTLQVTYVRAIEDFDSSSDNPDYPVEWSEALTYGLAMRLGSAYGRADLVNSTIGPMAQAFYATLLASDNEKTHLSILPDCED